jgi:hypothetical protein
LNSITLTNDVAAAIAGNRLAEQVLDQINRGTAGPDAIYLSMVTVDNPEGQRAMLRRVQKALEAAHATA